MANNAQVENKISSDNSTKHNDSHSDIKIIPASHWESLGHSEEYGTAMKDLQLDLRQWIRTLQNKEYEPRIEVSLIPNNSPHQFPGGLLLHDDLLLPLWKKFAEAIQFLAVIEDEHKYERVVLEICYIQLSKQVLDLLTPALKAITLNGMILNKNAFGRDGIEFVANIMESNNKIEYLDFCNNEMNEGCDDALIVRFAESIRRHPRLIILEMTNCELGLHDGLMAKIMPAIAYNKSLSMVLLKNNQIRSFGATLISLYLASNPHVNYLDLDDNNLDDNDAKLLAQALKYNSRLRRLGLMGNTRISPVGVKTLYEAIYDNSSLNTIHDSNHTCHLDLFQDFESTPDDFDRRLLSINQLGSSCYSKRQKIFHAIQDGRSGEFCCRYLNDVPLEAMPKVLSIMSEKDTDTRAKQRNLNRVFHVMREWNMPCLYTTNEWK